MLWLYLIALAVLGAILVVLIGRWDGAHPPQEEGRGAAPDDVDELLSHAGPAGITARDLDEVVLDSAPRGYRMDQVDKLLDALAVQLRGAPAEGSEEDDASSGEEAGQRDDQGFDRPSG